MEDMLEIGSADGLEVRPINDDNIIATILDPADISYV